MHIFDDNILKLDQKAYETEVVEGQSILPSYWCYFFFYYFPFCRFVYFLVEFYRLTCHIKVEKHFERLDIISVQHKKTAL